MVSFRLWPPEIGPLAFNGKTSAYPDSVEENPLFLSAVEPRLLSHPARSLIIIPTDLLRDRLCGLVVTVLSYRSGGSGSIPGTIRKK
jgi:hypothetical protein